MNTLLCDTLGLADSCNKKNSPKREFSGRISRGGPGVIQADGPGQKLLRKILASIKFLSAILGSEMGASILWMPGKMRSFSRKNSMSIKFLVLGGGGYFGFWGGSADFIFMGARIFLNFRQDLKTF